VLVDTLGLLLAVVVLAADVSDRDGALLLLAAYHARYPELHQIWGDSHYGGDLGTETQAQYGITVTVVQRPAEPQGFTPLPRRWIVERSLAGMTHCRRLARDYERDPTYSEAWIHVATIHQLAKRLAPDHSVPTPYERRQVAA
jgi:transposase